MGEQRLRYKIANSCQDMRRSYIKGNSLRKRQVPYTSVYTSILYKIFTKIFREMLFNMYQYTMRNLGTFYVIKYLPETKYMPDGTIITNRIVDIKATIEAIKITGNRKVRIYHENTATGGWVYKSMWKRGRFTNSLFYKFSLLRPHEEFMYEQIMAGNVEARVTNFKL